MTGGRLTTARYGWIAVILLAVAPIARAQQQEVPQPEWGSLLFAFGTQLAPFDRALIPSAHLALHVGSTRGLSLMATLGWGDGGDLVLFAGYRWGFKRGPWRLYVGPELGFGFAAAAQQESLQLIWGIGPFAGISAQISSGLMLTLEAHCPLVLAVPGAGCPGTPDCGRQIFQPALWLGFSLVR